MSQHLRTSGREFSSRQQRMWRRNQNTVAFAPSTALGPISHTVLVALMMAVLGLIYLTQVTKTSIYGYDINESETRLSALSAEKEDLENENARLQALKNVSNSDVAKALTSPSSTEYVQN